MPILYNSRLQNLPSVVHNECLAPGIDRHGLEECLVGVSIHDIVPSVMFDRQMFESRNELSKPRATFCTSKVGVDAMANVGVLV